MCHPHKEWHIAFFVQFVSTDGYDSDDKRAESPPESSWQIAAI